VDRLGTLEDAIALAQQRAGLSPGEAHVRRASGGDEGGLFGGGGPFGAAAADRAVARALSAVPELRALSLLAEMGPVIAMPVEWVGAAAP
jgi:protease-4